VSLVVAWVLREKRPSKDGVKDMRIVVFIVLRISATSIDGSTVFLGVGSVFSAFIARLSCGVHMLGEGGGFSSASRSAADAKVAAQSPLVLGSCCSGYISIGRFSIFGGFCGCSSFGVSTLGGFRTSSRSNADTCLPNSRIAGSRCKVAGVFLGHSGDILALGSTSANVARHDNNTSSWRYNHTPNRRDLVLDVPGGQSEHLPVPGKGAFDHRTRYHTAHPV
jgi:hypothetical protein